MSPVESKMFLSSVYMHIVVLLCIAITFQVEGRTQKNLTVQDVESKIADLNFFLGIFCDDPDDEECDDLYIEVNTLFKNDDTTFKDLEAAVITNEELIKKYGVEHFPSLVFFRNSDPIFNMEGELDTPSIYMWMEQHRHVKTITLTDATFEHDTQATSGATTGDWFIMFYENHCAHLLGQWETVAGWLHQKKVVGKIELSANPLTQKRFGFDRCVTVALLASGKMYIYNGDLTQFDQMAVFARSQFKSVEALDIPVEPAAGFSVLELLQLDSIFGRVLVIGGGILLIILIIVVTLTKRRKRRAKFD